MIDFKDFYLHPVHCRTGSLESHECAYLLAKGVLCRTGSLEMQLVDGWWTSTVLCRTGSLERYRMERRRS